ncbi:hypothetical protein BCY76_009135 [Nesterenkonia sp. PF2B19]|nr:hypothetical protein BCY76_009135 [Nesterenkonia sp. PF2B19]
MEDSEGIAAAHDNHQNRNGAADSTSPATRPLAVDLGDEFTDAELDPEALREQVSPDYDLLPEVDAPGSAPRGDRIGRHGRHHHEHPAPRRGEEEQLDLRKLLLFERAVSAGSLSAAAVELGWSQPAVSQQLSTLEHSLGTRLLTRTTRGVVPTPAGRILLGRAEAIRAQARGALEDLRSAVSPVDQTLRIAAFPSLLGGALAPSLEQLVGGGGGGFEVLEHEPPEALDLLRRGRSTSPDLPPRARRGDPLRPPGSRAGRGPARADPPAPVGAGPGCPRARRRRRPALGRRLPPVHPASDPGVRGRRLHSGHPSCHR